jgi:hypothetical protein
MLYRFRVVTHTSSMGTPASPYNGQRRSSSSAVPNSQLFHRCIGLGLVILP